jgi:hypothetical protein
MFNSTLSGKFWSDTGFVVGGGLFVWIGTMISMSLL